LGAKKGALQRFDLVLPLRTATQIQEFSLSRLSYLFRLIYEICFQLFLSQKGA